MLPDVYKDGRPGDATRTERRQQRQTIKDTSNKNHITNFKDDNTRTANEHTRQQTLGSVRVVVAAWDARSMSRRGNRYRRKQSHRGSTGNTAAGSRTGPDTPTTPGIKMPVSPYTLAPVFASQTLFPHAFAVLLR